MKLKKALQRVPKIPLSALVFYLFVLLLWRMGIVPSPVEIIHFLEGLYHSYGLAGLFMASFLEGIVYFGFYFPGSFIVALAVILSDGSLIEILKIAIVVSSALTITSVINHSLGRMVVAPKLEKEILKREKDNLSKGMLASMLHPNMLAFYFFSKGMKRHSLKTVMYVPLILVPYGLVLGSIIYTAKEPIEQLVESPYFMVSLIMVWMAFAFVSQNKKKVFWR